MNRPSVARSLTALLIVFWAAFPLAATPAAAAGEQDVAALL